MLGQLNTEGKDKVDVAIERFKTFEPKEGYYLAFSGGKDSTVIYDLAKKANVKFDAHYNLTTVDPPELVKFIKTEYKDVELNYPKESMWRLIEKKKMPPTRRVRYCCDKLKENGGNGRFVVTGVRWAESARRKNSRDIIEFDAYGSQSKKAKENREIFLMSDNEEKRQMLENCTIKGKHILNPIIDWSDEEIWNYIKSNNLKYCSLYDEGFERLGCIGCPLASAKNIQKEFERYPKYYKNYIKAFDRMLIVRRSAGLETQWKTGQDVMDWWLNK